MFGFGTSITTLGIKGGIADAADGGLAPESMALFAAMSTQPDATRKALINTTIESLKTAGIWAKLDAFFVTAAHDEQAARVDWASPARVAVAVNSPTFTVDRGFTGDGSTSRVRTNYTPSIHGVNLTQNSAGIWVWAGTNVAENQGDAGANAGGRMQVRSRSASNFVVGFANDASLSTIGPSTLTDAIGLTGIVRPDSANKRAYKNGVLRASVAVASTSLDATEQWLCGANSTSFSTKRIQFAAWTGNLNDTEAADLYAIIAAYMTAIGA